MAMTTNNSMSVKPRRFHDENVLEINGESPDFAEPQSPRNSSAGRRDLGDSNKVNETNRELASTSHVRRQCLRTLSAEEQAERSHPAGDLALTGSEPLGTRDHRLRDLLPA